MLLHLRNKSGTHDLCPCHNCSGSRCSLNRHRPRDPSPLPIRPVRTSSTQAGTGACPLPSSQGLDLRAQRRCTANILNGREQLGSEKGREAQGDRSLTMGAFPLRTRLPASCSRRRVTREGDVVPFQTAMGRAAPLTGQPRLPSSSLHSADQGRNPGHRVGVRVEGLGAERRAGSTSRSRHRTGQDTSSLHRLLQTRVFSSVSRFWTTEAVREEWISFQEAGPGQRDPFSREGRGQAGLAEGRQARDPPLPSWPMPLAQILL